MLRFFCRISEWLNELSDIPLLMFRIGMGIGFYKPFMFKLQNSEAFYCWLSCHHFACPKFAQILTTVLQGFAVALLPLGLLTRIVSFFLFIMVMTAMVYVHWEHGYSASGDGVELCVYYGLILLTLVIRGPGRFSCDTIIAAKYCDLPKI